MKKSKISQNCKETLCDIVVDKKKSIMKETLESLKDDVRKFKEAVKQKQVA